MTSDDRRDQDDVDLDVVDERDIRITEVEDGTLEFREENHPTAWIMVQRKDLVSLRDCT